MTFARLLMMGAASVATACAFDIPAPTVRTDGRFNEWSGVPPLLVNKRDAPRRGAVDLVSVSALDDSAFLHLRIDVGHQVNAQAMYGSVIIAFDADGRTETGARMGDLDGADVTIELSRQDAPRPSGYGLGIGYRPIVSAGPQAMRSGYDLDLVAAPTFSSREFELRIARGFTVASSDSAFTGSHTALQVFYVVGADTLDRTPVAHYALGSRFRPRGRPSATIPVKPEGSFRLLQWNVGETQVRDELSAFARVIGAANPDIVVLDEVFRSAQRADIESLLEQSVDDATSWDVAIAGSGGRQKTVIASRLPLRPEPDFAHVPYPEGVLDSVMHALDDTSFAPLFHIEREAGLATVAAWVTVDDRSVLIVGVDLQSGGYDGSPRDRIREVQAGGVHERLEATLAPRTPMSGVFPVVIAGDLNMVGSRRPLDILLQRLPNSGRLNIAEPYRLGDRTQTTWRDPRDVFTPGRLDYLLFTPRTLQVRQSFVFDVAALADSVASALGVRRDDALITSHHLPIVADLALVGR